MNANEVTNYRNLISVQYRQHKSVINIVPKEKPSEIQD